MTSSLQSVHQSIRPELLPSINTCVLTYENAGALAKEAQWNMLGKRTVGEALEWWIETLSHKTALNYRSGIRKLEEHRFISPEMTLQAFALANHNAIIDRIKKDAIRGEYWSECTRQARAACYISFTAFLSRRSGGMINKAQPCKEGNAKTFFRVHPQVTTEAMTKEQWVCFLSELEKINRRDCLIAKTALQGGKRINEVLSLTVEQINWEKGEISFLQSKTRGVHKETIITYSGRFLEELKLYIGNRKGIVFVTKTEKGVSITQVSKTFEKAGVKANIPFKVTPHVLRASAVTHLKQNGFSDSDIMKVTGHACSEMIQAYDKSDPADNASKKIQLAD